MITTRQIEKLWTARGYERLFAALVDARPEASIRLTARLGRAIPAAAIAVIRLDELGQAHTPIAAQLLRTLLATQDADGGFGDPMTTALALRALLASQGQGPAVTAALDYLARLQKDDGLWPDAPIRRLPADPYASAYILFLLAEFPAFHDAVRSGQAVQYFHDHESTLDPETRRLWDRTRARLPAALHPAPRSPRPSPIISPRQAAALWS